MIRKCDACGTECELVSDPEGRPTWLVTVTPPGRPGGRRDPRRAVETELCSTCIVKVALAGVRLYPPPVPR